MTGWYVPPPSEPVKSDEQLRRERESKVAELRRRGLLLAAGPRIGDGSAPVHIGLHLAGGTGLAELAGEIVDRVSQVEFLFAVAPVVAR